MTRILLIATAALCLVSCDGGDGVPITVGGSVTGLRSTEGLVLQNNGGDPLTISADGPFTFATPLTSFAPYSVTVLTQPTASFCSVENGEGSISRASVTNVTITCRPGIGKYLYTLSGFPGARPPSLLANNEISGFSIDPITGALTEIAEATFAIDNYADRLHVDKTGKFLFIEGASLAGYAIDIATGALTPIPGTPIDPPATIHSLFFHPNGRVLYVAMGSSSTTANAANGIYAYSIDEATGALTPVPGSPYRLPQDSAPIGGAVNTAGTTVLAWTPSQPLGQPRVSAFAADATTGALTLQGSADLPSPATDIVIHPDGRYAYVPFGDHSFGSQPGGDVGVLGIEDPGAITVTVVPVPRRFFRLRYSMLDRSGQHLYILDDGFLPIGGGNSFMHAYRVDVASGALTPLAGSPYATNGGNAFEPVMDPTQRYIVAPQNPSGTVLAFEIDPVTGELMHLPGSPFSLTVGTAPQGFAFDLSGKFAYVADGVSFSVSAYSIDLAAARFTFINSYPTGSFVSDARIAGLQ